MMFMKVSRGLLAVLLFVVPFWMKMGNQETNRSAATTYVRSSSATDNNNNNEGHDQQQQQQNLNVGLTNPTSRQKKTPQFLDSPIVEEGSVGTTTNQLVVTPTLQLQEERKEAPQQRPQEAQQQQQPILPVPMHNWRGAPIGDGEDMIDSYHSFDHRPPGNDARDELLQQYPIYPCPSNGIGSIVSGQDPRYYEMDDDDPQKKNYKERNGKFICDVHKLIESPQQPCVVYSFGSWDEISFEVGMNQATDHRCHIHTFDPVKPPSPETASRNHFIAHRLGIGNADNADGTIQKLSTIMKTLGHLHIHILKIDVEGHEEETLPNIVQEGILDHVDQVSIEFHSNPLMKQGLDLLVGAGFGIVYARREDRCGWCTEVTMVKMQ